MIFKVQDSNICGSFGHEDIGGLRFIFQGVL